MSGGVARCALVAVLVVFDKVGVALTTASSSTYTGWRRAYQQQRCRCLLASSVDLKSGGEKRVVLDDDTLVERVFAHSFVSPVSGQRVVAWRRLSASIALKPEDAQRRWFAESPPVDEDDEAENISAGPKQHNLGRILPLIEPWEYDVGSPRGDKIRGTVEGKDVTLQPSVGGDACLSRGLYEDASGVTYEVGAPSEAQVAAWKRESGLPGPPTPPPLPLEELQTNNILALAVAAPIVASAAIVAIGCMTHHLQIEVFVI